MEKKSKLVEVVYKKTLVKQRISVYRKIQLLSHGVEDKLFSLLLGTFILLIQQTHLFEREVCSYFFLPDAVAINTQGC